MTINGVWPAAFNPSATLTGSLPLPATIPTRSPRASATAGLCSVACIGRFVATVLVERRGQEVAFAPPFQELDHLQGGRRPCEFELGGSKVFGDGPAAIEDRVVGPAGGVDLLPGKTRSAHPDDVEAAQLGQVAAGDPERNHV